MASAPGPAGARPQTAAFELSKLQNEIRVRDRQLDAATKDATALKTQIAAKERLLQQQSGEVQRLKERALKAEGDSATAAKELAALKVDKRKSDATIGDLQRQVERLKDKVAQLSARGPGFNEQVARLESEVKMLKKDNMRLADETKAVTNQLRAKDRELAVAQGKLAWAAQVEGRNKELENEVLAQRKAVEQAVAEARTLAGEGRRKDQDVSVLTAALEERRKELDRALDDLSLANAQVKASDARCAELSQELAVTREELARASAVAARVAASEAKAGIKVEGTVTMAQHVEEVKYLQGETARLKDKLALAERDLAVAHAIKEKFRTALEAVNMPAALEAEKAAVRAAMRGGASPARAAFARRFSAAAEAAPDAAALAADAPEEEQRAAAAAEVAALPEDPTAALSAMCLEDQPAAAARGARQGRARPQAARGSGGGRRRGGRARGHAGRGSCRRRGGRADRGWGRGRR